jgi:thiol-disulfide isomerase/thioredoxin
MYELYHAHFAKKPNFKASAGFLSELDDIDYNNEEDFITSSDYKLLVTTHYNEKAKLIAENDSVDEQMAYLKSAASCEIETIRDELLFSIAKFRIALSEDKEEFYKTFMAASANVENNRIITEIYEKLMTVSQGKPSPKFVDYENYEGGTTSLDDLKGKYVYVGVWATWYAPCEVEIPFLKELEKKYQGKNIEFVSVSVDKATDHEKWKKMIEENEMAGIQLFADNANESEFVTKYLIKTIPHYILIDPDGNIVNSNAPKPSEGKLINMLNKLNI